MTTEVEMLADLDQIMLVLGILEMFISQIEDQRGTNLATHPFDQIFQDLHFNKSLMMEPFLVPDDLDRNTLARFVVSTL